MINDLRIVEQRTDRRGPGILVYLTENDLTRLERINNIGIGKSVDQILSDIIDFYYSIQQAKTVYEREKVFLFNDQQCRAEFSHHLQEYMEESGLNQAKVAELSGLSPKSISNYILERTTPSLTAVRKIAMALGREVDDFID